jgi:hypothetical protein
MTTGATPNPEQRAAVAATGRVFQRGGTPGSPTSPLLIAAQPRDA